MCRDVHTHTQNPFSEIEGLHDCVVYKLAIRITAVNYSPLHFIVNVLAQ